MPRVNRVKKAQKDQGSCTKCGIGLYRGDAYLWFKFRHGGKVRRCVNCYPKASELTQSAYLSALYSLQEGAEVDINAAESLEDVQSACEAVAEGAQEIVEEFQESLDNIESGMGHTDLPAYEDLDERRQSYEDWAMEMEDFYFEDPPEAEDHEDDKDPEASFKEAKEEWLENVKEAAKEAVAEGPASP